LIVNKGMSLRDYFAAKAMQGMSANPGFNDYNLSKIAELSYKQADEMLKARNGTCPENTNNKQ